MLVCFISLLRLCGSRLLDVLFLWLVVIFVTWCNGKVWLVDDCFLVCVLVAGALLALCLFAWLLISYSALKTFECGWLGVLLLVCWRCLYDMVVVEWLVSCWWLKGCGFNALFAWCFVSLVGGHIFVWCCVGGWSAVGLFMIVFVGGGALVAKVLLVWHFVCLVVGGCLFGGGRSVVVHC